MGCSSAQAIEASYKASAVRHPLHVIATTDIGTRAALLEARRLATRLDLDRVVVLVPRLHASVASLESPETDSAIDEKYRRIAEVSGVHATIRLCVCGALREMFEWMLPRGCTVVVGGRRRWWWPTPEQRIADLVRKTGHVSVFAEASEP